MNLCEEDVIKVFGVTQSFEETSSQPRIAREDVFEILLSTRCPVRKAKEESKSIPPPNAAYSWKIARNVVKEILRAEEKKQDITVSFSENRDDLFKEVMKKKRLDDFIDCADIKNFFHTNGFPVRD